MVAWAPNETLPRTIMAAARDMDCPLRTRLKLRRGLGFASDEKLREIEREMTKELMLAGVMLPAGCQIVEGILVGDWGVPPILQWLLDNWPKILEMILAIISLF